MDLNNPPYDPKTLETLALIVDRARSSNGVLTHVSRADLSSGLETVHPIFSAANEPPEQQEFTSWDLISEEHPHPTRRYKIFKKARNAKDPLAALKELSRGRSPSELYRLQAHINSRARSDFNRIEKSLPKLKTAEWSNLSTEQKLNIVLHMKQFERHFRSIQSRSPNPMELRINEAIHELARIFAIHTHFDGIDSDLPYSPASRYVGFVCIALAPFVKPRKLTKDAISRRWGRIKGLDI